MTISVDKLLKGQEIRVVKTDTLKMEFVKLPIQDLSFRFLYRFVEPIETVWIEGTVSYFKRTLNFIEGQMTELSQPLHEDGLLEKVLKDHALSAWETLILNGVPKREFPESVRWLLEMKDVQINECEIVKKS